MELKSNKPERKRANSFVISEEKINIKWILPKNYEVSNSGGLNKILCNLVENLVCCQTNKSEAK